MADEGRQGGEGEEDAWKQRRIYGEQEEVRKKEQEIYFTTGSQSYCVCFVSMMNSTETTLTISNPDKIRRYYSVFINTMAAIARSFDAKIIKNTGTSLVYYFPKTSNFGTVPAFRNVIECGVTMMAANKVINTKLKEEGLPHMHYKISADYGRVEVARSHALKACVYENTTCMFIYYHFILFGFYCKIHIFISKLLKISGQILI